MLNINEYTFELTAKAVYAMNDSCRRRFSDWKGLYDYMIATAHTNCFEHHSVSTFGFQLTAWNGYENKRCVNASVAAFLANEYAEKVRSAAQALVG